jgi:anti-sigma28 factor (negative regulator of flagellin synthesis)
MAVKEVTNSGLPLEPVRSAKPQPAKEEKAAAKDKVELSAKARSLFESEQAKKAAAVRKKIDEGFYFTDEVNEKVIDGLVKDLREPSER